MRVLLFVLSLIFGIALVEVLLRLQEPRFHLMGARGELGYYAAHPIWHHWLRPNTTRTREPLAPEIWPNAMVWEVNAQGCRYRRDLPRRAPTGAKRIIVMGDSFTEGYYQDTTLAAVLEQRLYQAGGPVLYEVVNCGTSSYSPMLHYLRYKHHLSRYNPDVLILNLDLTDLFDDNQRYAKSATFGPDGEPLEALPQARGLTRIINNLKYRFHFARLLFGQAQEYGSLESDDVFDYHFRLNADSARWQKDVAVSLSYIQRLIDLTRRDGVELLLTTYPYERQFRPEPGSTTLWHRDFEYAVKNLAERNQVQFYSAYDDLLPYMKRGDLPIYWNNDFHFTPLGQRIWSSVFADFYINRR